jgi:biopolymer transport protein TolQ
MNTSDQIGNVSVDTTAPLDPGMLLGDSVAAVNLAGSSAAAQDLSLWGLFWGADFFVQFIMLLLLAASVWSWTIIFSKVMMLRRLYEQGQKFEKMFWGSSSLDDLYDRLSNKPKDPMAAVFCAAMREWRRSIGKGVTRAVNFRTTLQDRIERAMYVTIERESEHIFKHMGFLGSMGSAPLLCGLLGTVWGIMHNFQSIAASKNTSLAVVAPGIAEALFATAIGLIAAIPASIAYNRLSGEIDSYRARLETFMAEFGSIISRQLEEGAKE